MGVGGNLPRPPDRYSQYNRSQVDRNSYIGHSASRGCDAKMALKTTMSPTLTKTVYCISCGRELEHDAGICPDCQNRVKGHICKETVAYMVDVDDLPQWQIPNICSCCLNPAEITENRKANLYTIRSGFTRKVSCVRYSDSLVFSLPHISDQQQGQAWRPQIPVLVYWSTRRSRHCRSDCGPVGVIPQDADAARDSSRVCGGNDSRWHDRRCSRFAPLGSAQ